jgi:diguanylate cyclase (GGDEF)-like protein
MWDLDVRRGRLTWEAQAAEILGVGVAALPGTVAELAALVQGEDAAPLLAAMQQLVEAGAFEVGVRVGRGAGVRYLSLRGKILDRDHRDRPLRAVGLALDITAQKAMEEQMLRMVMSDALTGIPNRRAFDQALRTEARRCGRELEPLSVVMVDIDNFKGFNDTFGHLVGDTALVAVARALTGVIQRAGDVLARFGGEEFAVVLPGVDDRGAFAIARRLVEAVRSVAVRQAPGWDLSVSVGSASWHPGEAKLRPVELLTQADQALYAAKAAGKDCAVAHSNA